MDTNEQQVMSSTPTSSNLSSQHPNTFFDFDFEPLVDEDDLGFNINSDTDPDNFSDADVSSEAGNKEADDSDDDSDSIFTTTTNKQLYDLTSLLQTEFQSQPKSTQLILTHEVAQLYKSYKNHGSAARLSASIMSFLDGGDEVFRPAVQLVEVDELDAFGCVVGRKKVEKKVIEKAKLRFAEPKTVSGSNEAVGGNSNEQHVSRGKRKAEDEGLERSASQERRCGPAGGFGAMDRIEIARRAESRFKDNGSPSATRPKTAGKVFPADTVDMMDTDGPASGQGRTSLQHSFSGLLTHPGPQNQRPSTGVLHAQPRAHASASQRGPEHPLPSSTPTPTPLTDPRLHHLYSLTTDQETQALLIGPNPALPFHPLADLKIEIPVHPLPRTTQPHPHPHPHPQTPRHPPTLIPTVTRILALHTLSAQRFYTLLTQKYTPTNPSGPLPPAALFRLGITSRLHHTLHNTFQPTVEHEHNFSPVTRRLLKDLFENVKVGRHDEGEGFADGEGPLNLVEARIIAKATRTNEVSVEEWWKGWGTQKEGEGENQDQDEEEAGGMSLGPWVWMCGWMERREREACRVAIETGRW